RDARRPDRLPVRPHRDRDGRPERLARTRAAEREWTPAAIERLRDRGFLLGKQRGRLALDRPRGEPRAGGQQRREQRGYWTATSHSCAPCAGVAVHVTL